MGKHAVHLFRAQHLARLVRCFKKMEHLQKKPQFIKLLDAQDCNVNSLMLPTSFMTMVARKIPNIVTFVLNNGMEFLGYCSNGHGKFYALQAILEGVGLDDFRTLGYMVFTYDMSSTVKCSFFDGRNVEVILHDSPLEKDTLLASITLPKFFVIEVKPSHMLPYCYEVDIHVEYKNFTNMWKDECVRRFTIEVVKAVYEVDSD
ncbi:hypothetical protein DCAR_0519751 [Daucus carota subsp. sativus]|uniref:Uncharacterized protein n=1 Tax=Daucus carota subsp. sativus TaxID=79200 RepID=A0A164Y5Q9_DAUCS|nr:hypothetical protein DCAR_0519751 [Daucus carota subsp. sativus]